MRVLLALLVLGMAATAQAQVIRIRRVEKPPPVTLAGLAQLAGPSPTGPCEFPVVTVDSQVLITLSLPDTSIIPLAPGWRQLHLLPGDEVRGDIRLASPDDGHVRLRRERNGAHGRHFLKYHSGEVPVGQTCTFPRGEAGAIWTFYEPDPGTPDYPRPFGAFGELMTPAGRWYNLTVWAATPDQRARTVSGITELGLRQTRGRQP